MRSVLIVIFVFFYLLLGLPVLGAMWIIHKFADGIDLVLVARVRAVGASYQEIEKSLLRALKDNKVAAART